jgi:phage/plasmid-associated DNA primase
LDEHGANICKSGKDVFLYQQTHWHHMDELAAADYFRLKLDALAQGKWDMSRLNSGYNRFLLHLPTPPDTIDMFSARVDVVNLLNGTLHLVRGAGRSYDMHFRPHDRADYITNVLPFSYMPESGGYNAKLVSTLEYIFEGDPDADDKKAGIQEMFGAALCGLFPMLFMLYGKPGTGKSTIANIARLMVGRNNTCSVPPTEWNEFNMWNMLGKLVNIDTDIPMKGEVQDDMLKKVIERVPVNIKRKYMKAVVAPLPACNIFCANRLPPFIDGLSGSQDRRWVMIETVKSVIPDTPNYDREIWDAVFDHDPQGVFNYAMGGLRRLCETRGAYTRSESGKAGVKTWQAVSDEAGRAVEDFFKDVDTGEVLDGNNTIMRGEDLKMERKKLWDFFQVNFLKNHPRKAGPGKHAVYDAMRRAGIHEKTIQGVDYWVGLGVKVPPDARY